MIDNQLQKLSPAYRLAALDPDFLLRDSMRGVRLLLEFAKAEETLRKWGVQSTMVVFGSSRAAGAGNTGAVEISASVASDRRSRQARARWWYEEARRFARIVSERGGAMQLAEGARHNVIATGGGPGIMEAANRGAFEAGAPSIGFNIELPQQQEPNPYTTPDLTFRFHSFAIRKMHLAMRATALVVFPGGFGTLDELFEILTLVQTRKSQSLPILCFDRAYWARVVNFDALLEEGMISPSDFELLNFVDDAEEAWAALIAAGLGAKTIADRDRI